MLGEISDAVLLCLLDGLLLPLLLQEANGKQSTSTQAQSCADFEDTRNATMILLQLLLLLWTAVTI